MEIVYLDPKTIQWPAIRVTAYYTEDQEELLKQSIGALSQQQPCVVYRVGDQYIGSDGKNRCLDAIERQEPTVPCVVKEGTNLDVLLSNMALSIRGRTKASDQMAVIAEMERLGLSRNEIGKKTGHGRAWVEQHIRVSQAAWPVRQFLDTQLLTLGQAHELAQIENLAVQERLCHQLLEHRWTVKELRERIRKATSPDTDRPRRTHDGRTGSEGEYYRESGPGLLQSSHCTFCHEADPAKLANTVVCGECSGDMIARMLKDPEPEDTEPEEAAPSERNDA